MKRFRARIWSILLSLAMIMGAATTNGQTASAKAKKIKLNKTSVTLWEGKKVTIKVKNTKKKAKWSIKSGKKYITLKKKKKSSVVVKAKKKGTAKVVAKVGGKKLICKIKVKGYADNAEDNDPVEDDATPAPTGASNQTSVPGQTNSPEGTNQPNQTNVPGPVVTNPPNQTNVPGPVVTNPPNQTNVPGPVVTNPPEQTNVPGPVVTNPPEQTNAPGQNVDLPSDATKFTIGTKELAIGMSRDDVSKVLGRSSEERYDDTGKAPQGFDTIAYNKKDYSEYLLIYLQNDKVVGICGISKSMSFGDVMAGQNGNLLDGSWLNMGNDYKAGSKNAAKKKTVSANEQAYAFYDVLGGDNTIYCIQVFDPTKIKDTSQDMIYGGNLSYDQQTTQSIATEIGHMLNAFRVYRSLETFYLNDGLKQCAQNYCNTITATKIDCRNEDDLFDAMIACGVDPMKWGEGCYYDAADAISFANSLIELSVYYPALTNPNYCYLGVGMAFYGKHTYVAVDYVDEI